MKNVLKKLLSGVAPLFSINFLSKISGQGLVLPLYHTVSNEPLAHIKHLYPVISVERFRQDLDFLSENFNAVNYDYLLHCVGNKVYRKEKAFFLTFDDGLRQFHDVVAPILLEKGIPAVCFVNPAFIDNKDMFYRLKFSVIAEKMLKMNLSKDQNEKITAIFAEHDMNYNSVEDLFKIGDADKEIADKMAQVVDIDFSEYLKTHKPYMTYSQLQSLISKGFIIGAHSMTHAYFPDLTEEKQLEETLESVRWVKSNFNQQVSLFSFPYTDFKIRKSFFEKLKPEVNMSFGTASLKLDRQKTNFQRIPMEVNGKLSAKQIIKSVYLYFIFKMLINKHIIIRN